MGRWKVVLLLTVVIHLAEPRCLLCQHECQRLPTSIPLDSDQILLRCDKEEHHQLERFVKSNDFTNVHNLTILTPTILDLNLTKFYNVSILDFSNNNITHFNLSVRYNTINLNLSNNFINTFNGEFSQLVKLDLSNNLLKALSRHILNSKYLTYLYLENNRIEDISNVSSNTLKYLHLKHNKITHLKLGRSPNLKEIDASYNLINKIFLNISLIVPTLEVLNLSYNTITELEDYSFNLTNLLKLDLRHNNISRLSQKCFYGLNRLQYLDISSNKIETVSPSAFQYLSSLIHLMVSHNREITSQDFGLLLASRRLKSVYASETSQIKIPSSLTRSVRYLVLSFNNISQIQCGDLDSYPLLNSLDLASNNISYIEDDALGRLDFLVTLNLDENFLSTVPHTLPNNLKNLFIRTNKIKSIGSNDFTGLQQLIQLDFSLNKIQEIKDDTFSQLLNLEKLNLSGNHINSLLSNSFAGPRNLKVLDLSYLKNLTKCEQTSCFPVPEYNNLQELHLQNSSVLVNRFMNDVAALKTFKQLQSLNIANSYVKNIRKDLSNYLPRLNWLDVRGNNLNCSEIKNIFAWFVIKEIEKCIFYISEDHSRKQIFVNLTTITNILQRNTITTSSIISSTTTVSTTTKAHHSTSSTQTYQPKDSKDFVTSTESMPIENNTEQTRISIYPDFMSNDTWFKKESSEMVDISPETPRSHPGLFVLLLLPLALSTCLFIYMPNTSRMEKNRHNPIHSEMDIEISNISSELW